MTLHAVLSVMEPGGELWVYGARDEGIGSVAPRLQALIGPVEVIATGGRCRVLGGRRPEPVPGLVPTLSGWRETFPLALPGIDRSWASYPGVFAHGRLDEGSALLAGALPVLPVGARALDFGCGSGVLGALLLARQPGCTVDFLDIDSVALEAVRENVPGARRILSAGLAARAGERYRLIVSNPPIHAGKAETMEVLRALVAGAGGHLAADGELWLVTQRRLPVQPLLERSFGNAAIVADDGRLFRVWRATRDPKGPGLTPGASADPPGQPAAPGPGRLPS